jgi:hypothetical protein
MAAETFLLGWQILLRVFMPRQNLENILSHDNFLLLLLQRYGQNQFNP